MLCNFANQLKDRAGWLDIQEKSEAQRAPLVNFLPLGPGVVPVSSLDGSTFFEKDYKPLANRTSPLSDVLFASAPNCLHNTDASTPKTARDRQAEVGQVVTVDEQTLRASTTPASAEAPFKENKSDAVKKNIRFTRQSKLNLK